MLSGLVAAFATMLPTPACAIMFCIELMGSAALVMTHGMNYTGTIVQLGLAGTTANLVYTSIATYTYINNETELPGVGLRCKVCALTNVARSKFNMCQNVPSSQHVI